MDIEYSLPLIECRYCDKFVMSVKRQIYLYPTSTRNVVKVTCKYQRECIERVIKQNEMERKKHEDGYDCKE